jgi:hypothetical protein
MLLGFDYETANRRVAKRLESEMAHLFAVVPEAAGEIAAARHEADAANDRATRAVTSRQTAISNLEAALLKLGQSRDHAAAIQCLASTPEQTEIAAQNLLGAYLEDRLRGSIQSKGRVQVLTTALLESIAVKPYVKPYIQKLNAEAEQLLEAIRADSRSAKISLPKLLASMKSAAGGAEIGSRKDPTLVGYFFQGHYADLE